LSLFLIDILILNKFYYFYFGLPLLLLSVLLRYFKYLSFKNYYSDILKLEQNLLINNVLLQDNPNNNNDFPVMTITVPEYLDILITYNLKRDKNPFEDDIELSLYYFETIFPKEKDLFFTTT